MIEFSKKRKWLLTGVATLGAVIVTISSVGSAGANAPAGSGTSNPAMVHHIAPANLPSGGHESSYTTVAPCRIVDTRASGGGNLVNGVARTFAVSGTTGFPVQGGQSGGCNIPAQATAITANISGTLSNGNGFLRAYANGSTEPLSVSLLLVKNVSQFTGTTIPVVASGMTVKAIGSNTRFVADVTGYYIPKMYAVVNGAGTFTGFSRIGGYSHTAGTGLYQVFADTDVSSCAINVSSIGSLQGSGYAIGTNIYVLVTTAAGTAVDGYWNLSVTC